jgi:hypothetical protein
VKARFSGFQGRGALMRMLGVYSDGINGTIHANPVG